MGNIKVVDNRAAAKANRQAEQKALGGLPKAGAEQAPSVPVRHWVAKAVAFRLPRSLVYWCIARAIAHVVELDGGRRHPAEIRGLELLQRWNECPLPPDPL